MKNKVPVRILEFNDNILKLELEKYKNINNSININKGKLLDYAVLKTFNPQNMDLLKVDREYRKFLEFMESKK